MPLKVIEYAESAWLNLASEPFLLTTSARLPHWCRCTLLCPTKKRFQGSKKRMVKHLRCLDRPCTQCVRHEAGRLDVCCCCCRHRRSRAEWGCVFTVRQYLEKAWQACHTGTAGESLLAPQTLYYIGILTKRFMHNTTVRAEIKRSGAAKPDG